MKTFITTALFLAIATRVSAQNEFLRDLQGNNTQPPPPPRNGTRPPPPKKYDENITIAFNANLGCGSCIRGGYTYCIPGPEGSNNTQWKAGLKATCCQNASTCTQATSKDYNCSSQYSDKMMAKAMCPFDKGRCGNNTAFNFDSVGQNT